MNRALHKLRWLLLPFSILYGLALRVRHFLFDTGLNKSRPGATKTLVIGNLHVGGTGKTPHAEYFIRTFADQYRIAFLSRGYGRSTTGYVKAGDKSTASQIGDEPMQIHQKFPDLSMAVCEDRLTGIAKLAEEHKPELVILDDAFQHRRLQPDYSVILMPYHQPWWKEFLLPAGNLRDLTSEAKRADAIVVTKCPSGLSEAEINNYIRRLKSTENQIIAFTRIRYGQPFHLVGKQLSINPKTPVFGFAGIADTDVFEQYLSNSFNLIGFRKFGDHHNFSRMEIESLRNECGNFAVADPVLITTEKDAVRLALLPLPKDISIFVIPIDIEWIEGESAMLESIRRSVHSLPSA